MDLKLPRGCKPACKFPENVKVTGFKNSVLENTYYVYKYLSSIITKITPLNSPFSFFFLHPTEHSWRNKKLI